MQPAGRGTVFGEWAPADGRQVLAVSLDEVPVDLLAAAFDARDWQVLVLADDLAAAELPANFTALPAADAVLDHADVVLADGDLPGIAAALRHATPLVLAPRTREQRRHAERVAELGVGVLVRPADLDAAALRRTVGRLAVDEPARAAARRVRTRLSRGGLAGRRVGRAGGPAGRGAAQSRLTAGRHYCRGHAAVAGLDGSRTRARDRRPRADLGERPGRGRSSGWSPCCSPGRCSRPCTTRRSSRTGWGSRSARWCSRWR